MAPNVFETFQAEAIDVYYPLDKIIEENISVEAAPEESELIHPEKFLSEDFLNFFNDEEDDVSNNFNAFPNNEDLAKIFDDFQVNDDALHQSVIANFDENYFNIGEDEKPTNQLVIKGLDEFLQVPSTIAFEVPKRDQENIPATVIDHQNYIHLDNFPQLSLSYSHSFPNDFTSTPSVSEESATLNRKRGRKPNNWQNPNFTKEYVQAAVDQKDEQKRRNNVSSGQYRKRKAEILVEMEKEIEIEKVKKIALKAKSKKLKKQIKKLRKAVSLYIGAQNTFL